MFMFCTLLENLLAAGMSNCDDFIMFKVWTYLVASVAMVLLTKRAERTSP